MNENKQRIIKERLALKDKYIETWLEDQRHGRSTLTEDRIQFLGLLAEKNLKYLSNKQNLSDSQRQMKTNMHEWMRNSILDLNRLVTYGFIGSESYWDPESWGGKSSPPFDPEILRGCFPSFDMATLIEALVGLYGDDYAIPIANGIEKGLRKRMGWNSSFEVEVPVIRRAKKDQ